MGQPPPSLASALVPSSCKVDRGNLPITNPLAFGCQTTICHACCVMVWHISAYFASLVLQLWCITSFFVRFRHHAMEYATRQRHKRLCCRNTPSVVIKNVVSLPRGDARLPSPGHMPRGAPHRIEPRYRHQSVADFFSGYDICLVANGQGLFEYANTSKCSSESQVFPSHLKNEKNEGRGGENLGSEEGPRYPPHPPNYDTPSHVLVIWGRTFSI